MCLKRAVNASHYCRRPLYTKKLSGNFGGFFSLRNSFAKTQFPFDDADAFTFPCKLY